MPPQSGGLETYMNILIIDGQGGKIGKQLVEIISQKFTTANITAVGTNSAATAAMLKGGATQAATGENAVVVAARRADVIIGPLGIVIADSLCGEISPAMALAVAQSDAKRILIPAGKCDNLVAGTTKLSISSAITEAIEILSDIIENN